MEMLLKSNNRSFSDFVKVTDNFPKINKFSRQCLFPKILGFNCNRKLYKRSGPTIRKCIDVPCSIITPLRLQDFAHKHVVRQHLLFTNWVQGPYQEIQAQGFSYSPSLRGLFGKPRACISWYGTSTQLVNSLLYDPF